MFLIQTSISTPTATSINFHPDYDSDTSVTIRGILNKVLYAEALPCPTYGLIKPLLIYILFLTPKRDAFRIRVSLFIERCQERMHVYLSRRLYSQAITKLVNNSLKPGKPSCHSHVAFNKREKNSVLRCFCFCSKYFELSCYILYIPGPGCSKLG